MPLLTLRLATDPDDALAAQLAKDLTDLTQQVLGRKPEVTAVDIDFVPPHRLYVNALGQGRYRASDIDNHQKDQIIAHLTVRVTQRTLDDAPKAAYLQQAYDLLADRLGGLHPVSYLMIQEFDAVNWGYGGLTQAQRFASNWK